MKGQDVDFEMISSNNMLHLQLQYRTNVVVQSRAIIIVCEELFREGFGLKKLIYRDALARADMAK